MSSTWEKNNNNHGAIIWILFHIVKLLDIIAPHPKKKGKMYCRWGRGWFVIWSEYVWVQCEKGEEKFTKSLLLLHYKGKLWEAITAFSDFTLSFSNDMSFTSPLHVHCVQAISSSSPTAKHCSLIFSIGSKNISHAYKYSNNFSVFKI